MIDTSKVGGNCICLMLSVYYKGRALPLSWLVYKGKKGHSSVDLQLQLLKSIYPHLPNHADIIFLGDGEFDSSELIKWLNESDKSNWQYVCRTATNIKVFYQQEWISSSKLPLEDGKEAFFFDLLFTQSAKVDSVNILALWNEAEKRHFFMVTNMANLADGKKWYGFRFTIETLFSDVKTRGFHLNKTCLYHAERVSRLILATAIAYVFTIFLGVEAICLRLIDRLARPADSVVDTYYSLFQIGLMYLDHLLNECLSFPIFHLPSPDDFYHAACKLTN